MTVDRVGAPGWSATVIHSHRPKYADPIRVAAEETVLVHREDDTYPGWWWCTAAEGREGWVPVDVLKGRVAEGAQVRLVADYDATELAVAEGERVTVEIVRRGWACVRNGAGARGWVPATHVARLEQDVKGR